MCPFLLHFFSPVARIEAQNKTVMENVGLVDMGFMITGGYNSVRTRAFAVTSDLSATEGIDRFFYSCTCWRYFSQRPCSN